MYKRLHIQTEDRSGQPVYRQIMDQICQYVVIGALSSGDQLPSIRELASQIGVNPQTIVKAYGELEHLGIIEMKRGRGAFMASGCAALAGIDFEKQLKDRMEQMVREAVSAGFSPEQLLETFNQVLKETGPTVAAKQSEAGPELKIIGGGSP